MKQNAQLMPMISVDSVDQARGFYVDKLGFDHLMGMLGKDGLLDFCTVTLSGAKVMLMRPQEERLSALSEPTIGVPKSDGSYQLQSFIQADLLDTTTSRFRGHLVGLKALAIAESEKYD